MNNNRRQILEQGERATEKGRKLISEMNSHNFYAVTAFFQHISMTSTGRNCYKKQ